MGKKPFIDRKNARHFHLVHRSQKDPLISDHEASSRVLVEVVPTNLRGKIKQIENNDIDDIDDQQIKDETESRVGKAALYGIHFDDTEYDYLQHLKPIGESEGGAVFIEAPKREKREKKKGGNIELKKGDDEMDVNKDASSTTKKDRKVRILLPEEALPSKEELPVGLLNQSAIPEDIQGFLPDMDPRLRETLEALEDDAYVENDLDDEFFETLNAESDEFYEQREEDFEPEEVGNWESEFKKFKNRIKKSEGGEDDYNEDDKRSRTTGGYSMTSSIMFRNDKLRLLDERFEKIEKEYMEEDIESDDDSTSSSQIRQDFSQILDEFLDKYEINGCKIVQKLEGENAQDQLETVRRSLGNINLNDRVGQDKIIKEINGSGSDKSENKRSKDQKKSKDIVVQVESKKKEAWDCQSILSTYSNFENHPILIREKPRQKIKINQKTGLPVVESSIENIEKDQHDNDDEGIKIKKDEDQIGVNLGVARSKNESKEEKKLRKHNNKDEKKNRRVEKKSLKRAFAKERTKQNKISHNLSKNHPGAIHLD
ncbi:1579_t:CDS:2 [Funneliformis geosporum]|uniref:70_t:CDS:1 n=1 Tax=Funneliformis geosporum TaxID=1117311 RepID=A0A9W4SL29_9GLOM|nr:1579_t:CDS:2 [Funneliformis geosporum]CAI2173267.1 70_t:CDS:2 [Funneliformis geosporum]